MARLVAKRVPATVIAAEFGCSTETIRRRVLSYGIRPKAPISVRYVMPPERLAEMLAEGWTLKEIAAEFGCDFSTVSLRLHRLGLR